MTHALIIFMFSVQWQNNFKCGTDVHLPFRVNHAAMSFDNFFAQCQPQASSFVALFGMKPGKCNENSFRLHQVEADTIVFYDYRNIILFNTCQTTCRTKIYILDSFALTKNK